jgi:hypothetical protein
MSKKHKKRRHQKHGGTKSVMNSTARGRNDPKEREKGRKKGILVLAGLLAAIGLVAYALNAFERTKGSGTVAGSNPPLLTATAAQQPLAPAVASTPRPNTAGPRIQFATPIHDFGQIKNSEVVKCTFLFTNVGDRLLEVTGVQASCGCTTAGEWSRKVEPGQTGSIPIQFNGGKFSGQVAKSITVSCNDTNQPTVVLQIKANIWKAIDVTPQFATLNVTSESPSNATTVRIVSNEEAPLTLSALQCSNPAFAAELRTNQQGRQFELIVKTVPPLPAGQVQGQITLKTSSTNMPAINVTAWANVQPAVVVMPAQISLPAAPLAKTMPYTLSIRNNGTNTLTLSEPMVTAQGIDVQLKEIERGRVFTATCTFPAGFELGPGKPAEFSVKSSHPQFPVVTVPILQPSRPAPRAIPQRSAPTTGIQR